MVDGLLCDNVIAVVGPADHVRDRSGIWTGRCRYALVLNGDCALVRARRFGRLYFSRIEGMDIGGTVRSTATGAVFPVLMFAIIAEERLRGVAGLAGDKLVVTCVAAITAVLFIATPAGNLTHLSLGVLSFVACLGLLSQFQNLTHPAVPSAATRTLVRWLQAVTP